MRKLVRITGFCLMLALFAGIMSLSTAANTRLAFSTQGLGTSMYVYASTIAQIAEKYLPAGYAIDIETTGGGINGPMLVGAKKADIALANSAPANWVMNGDILGRPPVPGFRAIVGGMDRPFVVVIFTEQFIKKSGITSLEEIAARKYPVRVAIKTKGMLGEAAGEQILKAVGASYDNIKSWGGSVTHAGSPEIVSMLRDNRADLTIDHIPAGQASIGELSLTAAIRFIPIPEDVRNELVNLGWEKTVMPKDTWAKQPEDMPTLSSSVVVVVREDLPDDVAYALTKAICENKQTLVEAHASIQPFDPKLAWDLEKCGVPLHPAAEKYYKDVGSMK